MISKRTIHGWTPFWCRLRAFVAMAVLCVDAAEMWSAEHNPQSAAVAERPAAHGIEVVRERYLDGRVKTEREVTTDAEGNYVNHGAWRMWNPAGKLVAEGAYSMGQRTGEWTKWLGRDEASLLSEAPFDQFDAPFASRAAFVADQMDGEWTISDASGRKCSTVQLKNGRRHGTATLWLATGQSYREASFRNALPAGDLRELDADGKIKTIASYVGGQQLVNRVTYYPNSEQKRIESACLGASIVEIVPDDFWQLQFAQYAVHGSNQRHGPWKSWYANGQLQSEGYYQFDRESGAFTWWHAHGQEAVRGHFADGRPDGTWTWWHANGQKAAEGHYRAGTQAGTWRRWAVNGRLVRREEISAAQLGAAIPRLGMWPRIASEALDAVEPAATLNR